MRIFSSAIIFLKTFNSEIKSNPSISNKLSCFKDFSSFKHFSFKNEISTIHKTFALFCS